MDSLLATYASSDEDEQEVKHERSEFSVGKTCTSLSSSLPAPKSSSSSSSLFSFLPPPKPHVPTPPSHTLTQPSPSKPITQLQKQQENQSQSRTKEIPKPPSSSSSSSIFSFLPPPKSKNSDPFSLANLSSTPNPKPKKIIHLKLPVNPSRRKSKDSDDDDDDDDDKEREGKTKATESVTETASVKSFLSSIPAPKNSSTLGSLPSAAGSGRRSILEADVTTSLNSNAHSSNAEVGVNDNGQVVEGLSSASFGDVGNSAQYVVESGAGDTSGWVSSSANYENYEGYGNYDYYGQYESNWGDGSTTVAPSDVAGTVESVVKVPGKRGRNDVPQEIIEVKQDELIKNRPREDQVKLTGIAFGPSYQVHNLYVTVGDIDSCYIRWIGEHSRPLSGGIVCKGTDAVLEILFSLKGFLELDKSGCFREIAMRQCQQNFVFAWALGAHVQSLVALALGSTPVSTKGKPSKLMKRKHQISSLYFDMRQKEMELAERRAKGFLTKAETQAKYGW
ncbi:hypothetical protein RHSIM_Rhsim13G0054400 [Rhododendron simsii]|uniref:Uncharacterized protein n=1 Tax=Rhododendron simsii TaxID=118357 RepID=A0A834L3I5_RHOSS|nr:hypothetical protein RHSIM_Rhsim13G0054400 [Rhododendron simsii]